MASSTTIRDADSTGVAGAGGARGEGGVDVLAADGWKETPEGLEEDLGFPEHFEYDSTAEDDGLFTTTDEDNAADADTDFDDEENEVRRMSEASELDSQGQKEAIASQVKDPNMMRLSRRIARSGVASRREAERLVEEGIVTVNGAVVQTPALNVGPGDIVKVKVRAKPATHTSSLRASCAVARDGAGRYDRAAMSLV